MTLALFFLGWFAVSLLLGAAWAGAATTRRGGVDPAYPSAPEQAQPAPGASVRRSDAIVS